MVYYLRVISLSEDLYFFSSERRKEKMLAIFNKGLVNPPQELHSPASLSSSRKPKHPEEIFKEFLISQPSNAFSINFGNAAALAYVPPENPNSVSQRYPLHHDYWDIWLLAISIFFPFYICTQNWRRWFCGLHDIYCMFMGSLNNLSSLNKQYGLSKGSNEAMFVIEAYRTLRDRGPYPAHQVLRDLDGSFGFVLYDCKAGTIFAALASPLNSFVFSL